MKKILSLVLTVAMLLGSIGTIAIAESEEYQVAEGVNPDSPVTLTMTSWFMSEVGVGDWLYDVCDKFHELYPNVTIVPEQIVYADYVKTLTVRMAAGDFPDIIWIPTRNLIEFAKEGWIADLTDEIAALGIDDGLVDQSAMWYNGQRLGINMLVHNYVLWYNKLILDKAGVDVPTTPEELMAVVEACTFDDYYGISCITTVHANTQLEHSYYVTGLGSSIESDGVFQYNDEIAIKATEMYLDCLRHSPLGNASSQKRELFYSGKCALMIDQAALQGAWDAIEDEELRNAIGVATLPFPNQLTANSNSVHLPASQDEQTRKIAWEFIKFMISKENILNLNAVGGVIRGRVDCVTDEMRASNPLLALCAEIGTDYVSIEPQDLVMQEHYSEIQDIVAQHLIGAVTENVSAEEVCNQIQSELEDAQRYW